MPPDAQRKIGVYCLANDHVLEWFQAFVRSLRIHDPDLPLTVIPYDDSVAKLKELQAQFNFSLMGKPACQRFDAIADRVAGQKIAGGTFRKLCCFFGEYESFVFLDSDVVVTTPLEPFLRAFESMECDLVYFDSDITMSYTPEFGRKMASEYGSPGFTTGSWIARRSSVTEGEILEAVERGEKIRDGFSIWGEQPFFNYLFDVTRRRRVPAWTILAALTREPSGRIIRHHRARDQYFDHNDRLIPFIHWAGCEWPTMFCPEIFLRYRTMGMDWPERTVYRMNFYCRRCRRQLKEVMQASGWLARRGEQPPKDDSRPEAAPK
jgi:hypothetical protein